MREIKFRAWDKEGKEHEVSIFNNSYKQHGYVKRKTDNHPFSDKRGYVMEHRLEVEIATKKILPKNAVIHHKNGVRDDNRIENLEYMVEQERHAKHHAKDLRRNENGQYVASDPIFGEIKFRLLNKNTGLTEIHTLGKLIATTYRRSQFEFRGRFTGLLDKNGKEIYEGDIIEREIDNDGFIPDKHKFRNEVKFENGAFFTHKEFSVRENYLPVVAVSGEIIGNIWENPSPLQGKK